MCAPNQGSHTLSTLSSLYLLQGPHCILDMDVIHSKPHTFRRRELHHLQHAIAYNFYLPEVCLQLIQLLTGEGLRS